MNHLFDIAGGIGPKPLVTVDIHVRFHEVFRLGVGEIVGAIAKRHGTVTVPGHVEELCPGGLKCLSIFQGFFEGNAFFGSVFTAVHADAENKIGTAALAGFLQDFSDDASTVFHILAAVFVIPAVPHAADKAVEKVAVRRMNLHAVEAALVRADDGLDNSLPHFVNLADAEAAAGVSVGRGHGNFVHVKRGRRYGQLAEARPGGRAGVMELRKNLASVRLNTPGQFLKAGNESVVIKPEIDAGRVFNGATAHNDRGRASFGNVFIQINAPAAVGTAVFIPQPGGLPCLDDTVPQYALRRNSNGGEQLWVFHQKFLYGVETSLEARVLNKTAKPINPFGYYRTMLITLCVPCCFTPAWAATCVAAKTARVPHGRKAACIHG